MSDSNAKADKVFPNAKAATLANAATDGDARRVQELVKQGADPNVRGEQGVTLLEWTLLQKSLPGMNALLEAGADPTRPGIDGATVLHMAAMANDPAYLKALLDHGANPDTPHTVTGAPPLDAALMNPDNAAFELLLAHHANPDQPDQLGNTPLHVAAQVHKADCVLQLLEAGADPERRNQRGDTFQTYFNIVPAGGLSAPAKAAHEKVLQWLHDHHVALRQGTP